MASRTGDKRLLGAPPAKGTSAGLCLALVLAALGLGGCGEDSPQPSSEGTSIASSDAAARGEAKAPAEAGPQGQGTAAQAAPARTDAGTATQGDKKQGARIVPPKGEREQAPSPAEIANATVADIALTSPSLPPGSGGPKPLLREYTCDGEGRWPALSWSGVPAGSAELILYAMNLAPVEGKLFVDWAVAGIDPALTGIESGKLPKGVVIGTNSLGKRGYEICPEGAETYVFTLYALPRSLSPRPGFDARELRKQILEVSGNAGLLPVSYARG